LGTLQARAGEYLRAIESFKEAIRLYPLNPDFYLQLGHTLKSLGRTDDALIVYREAVKLASQPAEALIALGVLLSDRGEATKALQAFDEALQNDKNLIKAYVYKNIILRQRGDLEGALKTLEFARSIGLEHADIYAHLGCSLELIGKSDQALQAYSKAIELDAFCAFALLSRADLYQKEYHFKEALNAYDSLLAAFPQSVPGLINQGVALYKLLKFSAAKTCFEKVLKIEPHNELAYSHLGVCLHAEHRHLEALVALNTSLEISPSASQVYSNRGNVLKELGQLDAALDSFTKALSLQGDYAEALLNRGVVHFELNNLTQALEDYNSALTIEPKNALALCNKANALKQLGHLEESANHYALATEILHRQMKEGRFDYKTAPPKPMLVSQAANALLDLNALLSQNDVPFFLTFGTLLGIYRDSELLPHDKDLDIGLFWDYSREKLLQIFKNSTRYVVDPRSFIKQSNQYNFGVIDKRYGISIDFFFFRENGENAEFLITGIDHEPHALQWRFRSFTLSDVLYRGQTFKIPTPASSYLEDIYGPQWSVADPYFDSLVSGYNLTQQSAPISLTYAYSRLVDHLNYQQWSKAYGYCVQILKLQARPEMQHLCAWLTTKI
jgi:tetratricopeptide (TPR) repeat protein